MYKCVKSNQNKSQKSISKRTIQIVAMKVLLWEIPSTNRPPTKITSVKLPHSFPSASWSGKEDKNTNSIVRIWWGRVNRVYDDTFHSSIL